MSINLTRQLEVGSTNSGDRRIVEKARSETAFLTLSQTAAALPLGTSVSGTAPAGLLQDVLEGFLPENSIVRRRLYREMFYNDPIIGSGIDLLSSFPFSDFKLVNVDDEMRMRKYAAAVDMVDVKTLLPVLSVDYLTLGKFIGNLHWNSSQKIFDALLPQNVDFCSLINLPIYGMDPVVKIELPPEVIRLLQGTGKDASPQLMEIVKRIPSDMLRGMTQKGGVTLDPNDLIYIARPGMVADYEGVSLLHRCLPIWLMEKALIRGTLDQVWKRQRGILWAQVGGEDWEPTQADYQMVNDLVQAADHDPTGAIITTRNGVNIQEIRRGDDFWRYDLFYDFTMQAKLSAMSISQSFVTGDATMQSMEGAVNVTLQHFKSYRNYLTKCIFYDKLFPTIAVANNFRRRDQQTVLGETASFEERLMNETSRSWNDGVRWDPLSGGMVAEFASSGVNVYDTDMSKFVWPKIAWAETLDNNTTDKMGQALELAEQHGVPIPIRQWIAGAGMSVEDLLAAKNSDINLQKILSVWRKEVQKYNPPLDANGQPIPQQGDDGFGPNPGGVGYGDGAPAGNDNTFSFASSELSNMANIFGGVGSVRPRGVLARDFGDLGEPRRINHKGNPDGILSQRGRHEVNDKMNKMIAETTVEAKKTEVARAQAAEPEPRRTVHRAFPLRGKYNK